MVWKKEPIKSKKEQKEDEKWLKNFKKKPKFLCDENLDADTAKRLYELDYNAISVYDIGYEGKQDEIIYQEAFKTDRVLLTNDEDFLDNKQFELKFSTPTIILPNKNFEKSLLYMLYHIAPYYEVFKEIKIKVLPGDYSFQIIMKNLQRGAIEGSFYRFKNGDLEKFYKN